MTFLYWHSGQKLQKYIIIKKILYFPYKPFTCLIWFTIGKDNRTVYTDYMTQNEHFAPGIQCAEKCTQTYIQV